MHQGKFVFTQLCEFLPKRAFDCLVEKYEGNKYVKSFTCWNHLRVLIFGQLTNRESLRDLVTTLNAHKEKFHHLGFGKSVTRSNLSKALAMVAGGLSVGIGFGMQTLNSMLIK